MLKNSLRVYSWNDVTPDRWPFSGTRKDYFVPLWVRCGKRIGTRYECTVTCRKFQAVHLEVAHSETTDPFLQAPQHSMNG